jgi:hypothetical protein
VVKEVVMNFVSEEKNAALVPKRKALLMNSGAHMYTCETILEVFSVSGGTTGTGADHGLQS